MSNAAPEPFWIARIAAGQPARLRNPGESAEDYRVAMGWDKPKSALESMKRFDIAQRYSGGVMCEDEDGDYVLYEAAAEVQRAHDELVTALRSALQVLPDSVGDFDREQAESALAMATGGTT